MSQAWMFAVMATVAALDSGCSATAPTAAPTQHEVEVAEPPAHATEAEPLHSSHSSTGPDQRDCEPLESGFGTGAAGRQEALEALARCVELAVPRLEREPVNGDLARFVSDAKALEPACADVQTGRDGVTVGQDPVAVSFCARVGSWDHFDDGTAVAAVVYTFTCDGCIEEARAEITVTMGNPAQ